MALLAKSDMPSVDTRYLACTHPRASGLRYTAIRITALKLIAKSNHLSAEFAELELARRFYLEIPVELSTHAIDAASIRYLGEWIRKTNRKIGLAAWLREEAQQAYLHGIPQEGNVLVREHNGMVFCFQAKQSKRGKLKLVSVT